MRLVQFQIKNDSLPSRIGILRDDVIADCTSAGAPNLLVDLLNQNQGLETLTRLSANVKTYPLSDVKLLAPVTKPDKVLCIGLNYKDHCALMKMPYPAEPIVFNKFGSSIIGPHDDIVKPSNTETLDWEVELVVVIGKRGKHIRIEDAYDHVLGYTVGQDLTARDWITQDKNGGHIVLGKAMDTFCPLGPCIVTKDEIGDPNDLKVKTWVNGNLKQNSTTADLVHRVDKIISYLSSFMTLYPGDVIMTGTPSGVGCFLNPPEALKPGDLVETEVEKIGKLSNRVV